MTEETPSATGDRHEREATILDAYLRALDAGEAPARDAILARHPDLAPELRKALDGLELVHRAAHRTARDEAPAGTEAAVVGSALGDYRLLREVGRGGMAVVYEAEQISLARRVALKVLPFAAVLDPRQLQRFKNEALAAAHLNHPHIVPVYGVGCDRGVHYYAMQFIDGQTLAGAIRGMKESRQGEEPRTPISSHRTHREPGYVRLAARLGMQAAEALDHAHHLGIVHRDVKPANLLLDGAGTLWVTDFGLARSFRDAGLTMTGELLGTVRYMSPEQTHVKPLPIDHRTDVYSLGATLYELFTLEPAFPGDDPQALIQDIGSRDPVLPRRLNPSLPRDLETVLLKAMSKDPGDRYATAQEMAEDLGRFLADEPVLARRPSLAARAARWALRHRGLVAGSFALLLVAVVALAAYGIRIAEEQRRTNVALGLARSAVDRYLVDAGVEEGEDWKVGSVGVNAELLEAALAFYGDLGDPDALKQRSWILHALGRYEDALAVLDRLLAIRPHDASAVASRGELLWHLRRTSDALASLDRAIAMDPGLAHSHFLRGQVLTERGRLAEAMEALTEGLRLAPDDPAGRQGFGTALAEAGDSEGAIRELRAAVHLDPGNAGAHYRLGISLTDAGRIEDAIEVLRKAVRLQPELGVAYYELAMALRQSGEFESAMREGREAVRLHRMTLRLRPDDPDVHHNLALALQLTEDFPAAVAEYREVIRLHPDAADARFYLGVTLSLMGETAPAIVSMRAATRIDGKNPDYWIQLGIELQKQGTTEEAMDAFRHAVEADPDSATARAHLGAARYRVGDPGALEDLIESVRLRPDHAFAQYYLGAALRRAGDHRGALRAFGEAARLEPDDPGIHVELAKERGVLEDFQGEIESCREAIRLKPSHPEAHYWLGKAYESTNDLDRALACYRDLVLLAPEDPDPHGGVGRVLARQGRFRDALASLRRAIELGSARGGWGNRHLCPIEPIERKAEAEGLLDRMIAGLEPPRDAAQGLAFAELLHTKSLPRAAVTLYAAALAQDPALADDAETGHRYDAACSAVRAAAGAGGDAAALRLRALEWLRADLETRAKAGTGSLRRVLEHWKRDADLAGVREGIDGLPEPEREEWRTLWADVEAALVQAGEKE